MGTSIPSHAEILYKLGQIETQIRAQSDSQGEAIKRIETKLTDLEAKFGTDQKSLETRVTILEKAVSVWKTRFYTILGVVSTIWVFVGDNVHNFLNGILTNA